MEAIGGKCQVSYLGLVIMTHTNQRQRYFLTLLKARSLLNGSIPKCVIAHGVGVGGALGRKDSLLSESSTTGTYQKTTAKATVEGDDDAPLTAGLFSNLRTPSPGEDTNEAVKPVVHVKNSQTDSEKPSDMKQLKREDEFLTSTRCSGLADDTMLNTPTGTNVEFARLFGAAQQKTEEALDRRGGKKETENDNGTSKNVLIDQFSNCFKKGGHV